MIIELNSPYSLNLGSNIEYISTYVKGKVKSKVEDYRILVKTQSGDDLLLMLEPRPGFFGRKLSYSIGYIDSFKVISQDHLKNKVYNYYNIGFDPQTVEDFFDLWKSSDPMIHIGNKTHQSLTNINGYTYAYKFNNKLY